MDCSRMLGSYNKSFEEEKGGSRKPDRVEMLLPARFIGILLSLLSELIEVTWVGTVPKPIIV